MKKAPSLSPKAEIALLKKTIASVDVSIARRQAVLDDQIAMKERMTKRLKELESQNNI